MEEETRWGEFPWPEECLEYERRLGCRHARLFPFIRKRVLTPKGYGQLMQVFPARVGVNLDGQTVPPDRQQMTFFKPEEILPDMDDAGHIPWQMEAGR